MAEVEVAQSTTKSKAATARLEEEKKDLLPIFSSLHVQIESRVILSCSVTDGTAMTTHEALHLTAQSPRTSHVEQQDR
jgi:hypothetical protein